MNLQNLDLVPGIDFNVEIYEGLYFLVYANIYIYITKDRYNYIRQLLDIFPPWFGSI